MKLKALFNDEDAVSPVIGVILMVAITVILAAVIGTFVLGLGQNVQDTAPTTSLSFDQQGDAGSATVKISHDGGDSLDPGRISLTIEDDGDGDTADASPSSDWASDSEITAGDTVTVDGSGDDGDSVLEDGDIVKVVWTSDSGETSSVLGTHEVN